MRYVEKMDEQRKKMRNLCEMQGKMKERKENEEEKKEKKLYETKKERRRKKKNEIKKGCKERMREVERKA